ncbi:MAG TPA: GNAT family N-acetyltransferase [Spongiibacteraceae bacterium]|nr:GNAT family N-acetyltransferase [Spongiibacteraceae bacterium]
MSVINPAVSIQRADYGEARHAADILRLMDEYARDPMGGEKPLGDDVKARLVAALATCAGAVSFIAYSGDEAIGLINCFETLSTFRASPLLNIHDVIVAASWRRRGIARLLFGAVELFARERHCCKLTLEVLEGNTHAQALYRDLGFSGYSLTPETGYALFWQKKL